MSFKRSLCALAAAASVVLVTATTQDPICVQIAGNVSSSTDVYYAGDPAGEYIKGMYHWMLSSTQTPTCVVEPGTAADVGTILQILGATNTSFAVKGGGHASNPGFSSTTGVQIAMYRFSEVTYDAASSTAVIGAGLIWDDVYTALAPFGVTVVGGRVTGVGVAGFTLGGGYSWYTNQYGLTIDTVTAFELVLPNGTVTTVTSTSNSDLFFALKGGFNNFGIVTKFTLKTFPQGQVWGGLLTYTQDQLDAVNAAVYDFTATVTDPKAGIISAYNFVLGAPGVSQILFYDGPTPPPGIFDTFLAITSLSKDISTRDFVSLVQASPSNATANLRGIFNTVSLTSYTPALLEAIVNETQYWGPILSVQSGIFLSYDVEPFLSTIFTHGNDSAYPPSRTQGLLPLNLYFAWSDIGQDDTFQDAVRQSAAYIRQLAAEEGEAFVVDAALYGNYAIFDTPASSVYGENMARLQAIKATVDPTNVMALAGGFKV